MTSNRPYIFNYLKLEYIINEYNISNNELLDLIKQKVLRLFVESRGWEFASYTVEETPDLQGNCLYNGNWCSEKYEFLQLDYSTALKIVQEGKVKVPSFLGRVISSVDEVCNFCC